MTTTQKFYTFEEFYNKLKAQLSLEEDDEENEFVTFDEFIGFLNDAIDEAEEEIHGDSETQDYFKTFDYVPLVEDEDEYDMPKNIYANKIRRVTWHDGSKIWDVTRYRKRRQFEEIELDTEFPATEEYRWYPRNDGPGERKFVIVPAARETATLPPRANPSNPMKRWYLRQANRVPVTGEYFDSEDVLPTAVDAAANTIEVAPDVAYVTGDKVKFVASYDGALPGGLSENTVYYVISVDDNTIKVATSLANANAGTAVDLTSQGTGLHTIQVCATEDIINATVLDLPEFSRFLTLRVKQFILEKDEDPRAVQTEAKADKALARILETLTSEVPDDDDEVEIDARAMTEMS